MRNTLISSAFASIMMLGVNLLVCGMARGADPAPVAGATKAKTVAIFVADRAKGVDDAKVTVMEDLVTAKITDAGFHVLSRDITADSVKSMAGVGPNAGDDNLPGAKLDALLSNNTSALRLAQNLGADNLLMVSITTFGQEVSTVNTDQVHARITESTLVCSYKILSGVTGESLVSDVVKASKKVQEQPGNTVSSDVIDTLLDQASTKLADSLKAKVNSPGMASGPAAGAMPEFYVECTMTDLEIPEVTRDANGQYNVSSQKCKLDVMSATVELDGTVVGTTPGPLTAAAGFHKIRVTRDGFKEWVKTISIRDGLHLNVPMQLTDEGNLRWRGNVAFLEQMKDNAKMSDADVKRVEGMAQMFQQSGFKVDSKSDVKGDTKIDAKANGTSLWPAPAQAAPSPAQAAPSPVSPGDPATSVTPANGK